MYLLLFTHCWENDEMMMSHFPEEIIQGLFNWVIKNQQHLRDYVVDAEEETTTVYKTSSMGISEVDNG